MQEVAGVAIKRIIDLLCIQEPYDSYGKLVGMPSTGTQVYEPPAATAALVVFDPPITATKISQCSDSHMNAVELR